MYCASCGTALTPGLSYCNRCGVNLVPRESSESKLANMAVENLIWAIVAMATLGMGVTIALLALMKQVLLINNVGMILIVAFSGAVPFLLAELMFIVMLLRSMGGPSSKRELPPSRHPTTKELEEPPFVRALNEPPLSVVEQTTRTLETVPRRRLND